MVLHIALQPPSPRLCQAPRMVSRTLLLLLPPPPPRYRQSSYLQQPPTTGLGGALPWGTSLSALSAFNQTVPRLQGSKLCCNKLSGVVVAYEGAVPRPLTLWTGQPWSQSFLTHRPNAAPATALLFALCSSSKQATRRRVGLMSSHVLTLSASSMNSPSPIMNQNATAMLGAMATQPMPATVAETSPSVSLVANVTFRIEAEDSRARLGLLTIVQPTPTSSVGDGGTHSGAAGDNGTGVGIQGGEEESGLLADRRTVATPAVVAYTRNALPLHLTPDMMMDMQARSSSPSSSSLSALQICSFHFHESPSPSTIAQLPLGVRDFAALPSSAVAVVVAVPRDTALPPSDMPAVNNRVGPTVETPAGRRQVTPQRHTDIVRALRPDLWVPLFDPLVAHASLKRTINAVDRTAAWQRDCIDLALGLGPPSADASALLPADVVVDGVGSGIGGRRRRHNDGRRPPRKKEEAEGGGKEEKRQNVGQGGQDARVDDAGDGTGGGRAQAGMRVSVADVRGSADSILANESGPGSSDGLPCNKVEKSNQSEMTKWSAALLAVVGGAHVEERVRSAAMAADMSSQLDQSLVAGFHLGGFFTGESFQQRPSLLKAAIDQLPPHKLRHLSGPGLPEEVLQAVEEGVDLIDSIYPDTVANEGCALVFAVDLSSSLSASGGSEAAMASQAAATASEGEAMASQAKAMTSEAEAMTSELEAVTSEAAATTSEAEATSSESADSSLLSSNGMDRQCDGSMRTSSDVRGVGDRAPAVHAVAEAAAPAARTEVYVSTVRAPRKLNLRDSTHRRSWQPLLRSCECYTCRCHTRAYLHHLLHAHEMLAQVLLAIHNHYHYGRFFEEIRKSIKAQSFQDYKQAFLQHAKL